MSVDGDKQKRYELKKYSALLEFSYLEKWYFWLFVFEAFVAVNCKFSKQKDN
jgi:hypothetical protein